MARKSLLFGSAIKSAINPYDLDSDVGWSVLSGDDTVKGVDLYFRAVPWLYRGTKDRAQNVGALPWAILKNDKETANSAEWANDKPKDLDWLDNPHKLFGQVEQSLTMGSKAYLFLECNNYGYIKSVKYCAPSTITEVYDRETGALTYYERTINGKKKTCLPASAEWDVKYPGRILAIYDADYLTEIGPSQSSPAIAALSASGVLYSLDQFVATFFSRGAIKASILSIESGSQAEHERLQHWWEDVIAGVKNAWSAIIMRGKVNAPVVIGEGIEGLENDSLTSSRRQDIATALGIPESRLWSAAANYATRTEDEKAYFRGTIIPEFDLIAEAFNSQIFTAVHHLDGYRIESQPETLDIFQEDEADRAASLKALTDAGIPLKTAMEILGYDLTDEQWAVIEEESKPKEIPPALQPFAGQDNPPAAPALPAPVEEPVQPVEETPAPKAITPAVIKELEIWQRKAIKAFKQGVGADCEFTVENIGADDAQFIHAELRECQSIDEIKAVFTDWQSGPVVKADPIISALNRAIDWLDSHPDEERKAIEPMQPITVTVNPQPVTVNNYPQNYINPTPVVVENTVNVPEQAAPVVNVAPPKVTVTAPSVTVTNQLPPEPGPRKLDVVRDYQGKITGVVDNGG